MSDVQSVSLTENNKVLNQTLKLTSLSLFFSFAVGMISSILGFTAFFSNAWVHLVTFIIAIGLIFYVSKNSRNERGLFGIFAFAGVYGLLLDPLVSTALAVSPGAVSNALLMTAAITLGMSFYAKDASKDFSFLGPILLSVCIALIVSVIINIFLGSSILMLAISFIGAIMFSLWIAYDVNQIVRGGEVNYIQASLSMFINIIGLFIHLLNIFTAFGGDD